jgi:regulatory protein
MARLRARLSLKGRALQLLAQRDQSRVELRRKLRRHAARDDETGDREAQHAGVEAVLDWLEAQRFLSAERFVESRIHAREGRFGSLRIKAELAQHGLELPADAARSLAETELERAAAVRERRFAEPPRDAAERARQARFLAARGFSPEAVHRLMRQLR